MHARAEGSGWSCGLELLLRPGSTEARRVGEGGKTPGVAVPLKKKPRRNASLVAFLLLVSAAFCVALARNKRLLRTFVNWYGLCSV